MRAATWPLSRRIGSVPVVAVYLTSRPSSRIVCGVCEIFSSFSPAVSTRGVESAAAGGACDGCPPRPCAYAEETDIRAASSKADVFRMRAPEGAMINHERLTTGTDGHGREDHGTARRTSAGCAGRREAAACDALHPTPCPPVSLWFLPSVPVRARPCPSVPGGDLFSVYSSSGAPPPDFATSSCLMRSTLNFCALAMILSSASSKSNDVAFEKRV